MKKLFTTFLGAALLSSSALAQGLIISEILPKPSGSESPYEYVELVATQSINFATTPYTVVVSNGAATSNGWKAGSTTTYGFQINTGSVNAGQVVYVGGSSMAPISNGGVSIRSINTSTVNGDGFGTKSTSGVFGNGGSNMDGIAVFNVAVASITASTVPVDAIFWGTGVGSTYKSSTSGYQLPVNDKYNGGKVSTSSYFAPDPAAGDLVKATAGTFSASSNTWTTARTWSKTTTATYNATSLTISGTGGNQSPTVSITSPSNGTNFLPPANITINANASDADGSVSNVEFYNGTTLLGSDATSPYSFTWSNVAAGNYTLTAKAYDNLNAVTTSSAVNITVSTVNAAPALSFNTTASKLVDLASGNVSCVMNSTTDPVIVSGLDITVGDEDLNSLTFTMTSSKTSVVPNANFTVTGTGTARKFKINPTGVGFATITLKVTDNGGLNKSISFSLAVATAFATGATQDIYHTGAADGSSAMPVDSNFMFVGDDENNFLRLYNRKSSGLPYYKLDVSSLLNTTGTEVDIEGSFRSPTNPNRIYWIGSMSNNKNGEPRPDRDRIFATDIVGTGANATLQFVGYYQGLRSKLIVWGDSKGYNFTAKAASGIEPKRIDGFNVEGLEIGPDGTTLYIGFRAPYVGSGTNKAVIAPLLNFESWFGNGSPSTSPTFGNPIELDLGNHGIRSICKNASNNYVISAGSYAADGTFALYEWNGQATSSPILLSANLTNLAPEGIVEVPTSLAGSFSIQLLSDFGGSWIPYNDAVVDKDITTPNYQVGLSSTITVSGGAKMASAALIPVNESANSISLKVYPNPVVSVVSLEFEENTTAPSKYFVYTTEGRLIKEMSVKTDGNRADLDLSGMEIGNYIIQPLGYKNAIKINKQ